MRLNKISLKQAVAMLAATCTLGTCCIAGSVAFAETQPQGANTANIDTTKANSTSITIHKYEAPELKDAKHDGRELKSTDLVDKVGSSSVAKKQVKGVEFTIWRLKTYQTGPAATGGNTKTDEVIDLSKADGWSKIKEVQNLGKTADESKGIKTVDQLMNGYTDSKNNSVAQKFNKYTDASTTTPASTCVAANTATATGAKCVTGEDGSVKLDQLPMGLYYIEETDISKAQINTAAAGQTAKWKNVSITKKVNPFFITTPLPNSDTATQKKTPWLYDVHVYPKNDTNPQLPTKTGDVNRNDLVGDKTVGSGTDTKTIEGTRITWTVSIPLTAPKDSTKYEKVGFVDRLNEKLTYENIASAKIITYKEQTNKDNTKEWVKDDSTDEVKLTKGTDYELTNPVKGTETGKNNNTLTFKLAEGTAAAGTTKATGRKAAFDAYTNASKSTNPKKLAKLVVEIVTKVDDDGLTLNEIANVANTFVDDNKTGKGDDQNNPCTPDSTDPDCDDNTPNEIMHYGTLTVSKFFKAGPENDNKEMPLNGAKFDLYEVTGKPAAKKGDPEIPVTSTELPGTTTFAAGVTTTDGQSTITTQVEKGKTASTYNVKKITHKKPKSAADTSTTYEATTLETRHNDKATKDDDKDGKDSVKLLVYKAPKGNPNAVDTTKLYCAVETEAPAGYKLDSAPHCVWLKDDSETDAATNNLVKVKNIKATELDNILGALPMTGARGLVILTLCGIVGIAGTFFYIVMKRRKEQEQE